MRRLFGTLFAAWTVLAMPAQADGTNPVVVELYTSQGCSSCPPADALLHEIANRDDVIALALHVDYWDYIGWKDEFADPLHTKRQKDYAVIGGRRSIYTPQMIINGRTTIIGTKPMALAEAISKYGAAPTPVSLNVQRAGGDLQIAATSDGATGSLVVQMVHYQPERNVAIKRGENAGHTFTYANVAQDWTVLAEWNGVAPFELSVPLAHDLPLAVIVQDGPTGPILAARKLQ
ncbi:MAG: DUF1223 domain-containing protein [Rhodobacteraceae bacterium]|nr:DUF1223 domain-containing protein [Paracoccaceae bacterium]